LLSEFRPCAPRSTRSALASPDDENCWMESDIFALQSKYYITQPSLSSEPGPGWRWGILKGFPTAVLKPKNVFRRKEAFILYEKNSDFIFLNAAWVASKTIG
jgi:hypothetical protein